MQFIVGYLMYKGRSISKVPNSVSRYWQPQPKNWWLNCWYVHEAKFKIAAQMCEVVL